MTAKIERVAGPFRELIAQVADRLELPEADFRAVYAPRFSRLGFEIDEETLQLRAAQALAAQWLVAYSTGALPLSTSLRGAETWFLGEQRCFPHFAPPYCPQDALGDLSPTDAFALLPYLLDPYAPATRRCVMKDGGLIADRRARKAAGVYYTPADLANHMARGASPWDAQTCLDTACGSGVFLRAASMLGGEGLRVFGCDIDPLAAEMSAFVLLATSRARSDGGPSPWARWHLCRGDLATIDSLLLRAGTSCSELEIKSRRRERERVRQALVDGQDPPTTQENQASLWLGDLFPELADGCDVFLSNPPYARLGEHPALVQIADLHASFRDASPTPSTNVFPPFVEHTWRLTRVDTGRAATVVPLSLASGTGQHLRALRREMSAQPGRWRVSCFDRAPDALFGDDVKTRNAIVEYRAEGERGVETTGLMRWTSRSRARFLATIEHSELRGLAIEPFVTKLGSDAEVSLYRTLRARQGGFGASFRALDRIDPAAAAREEAPTAVYVAPTAYNWLGCARSFAPWADRTDLGGSPLTRIEFESTTAADAAHAILSSRLTLWLWRVEGDGFHVSQRFVRSIPFDLGHMPSGSRGGLARLGAALWEAVARRPLVSVNKGKRTLTFSPDHAPDLLDQIDRALLSALDLGQAEIDFDLRSWRERLVVVDPTEQRRLSLMSRTGAAVRA